MMKRILIVAPHPDDETLGCGGTILKHKMDGDYVCWLIITNISTEDGYDSKTVETRQKEIQHVGEQYEFHESFKLDLPTTKLDMLPRREMIRKVSAIIDQLKPEVVYVPNSSDVHTDHKITFDVMISALKSFRCPFVKRVLMYEVISETEFSPAIAGNFFVPNSFSDISSFLEQKISIMKLYRGEMLEPPFPRSADNLKALAIFRGAAAGVKYAEAFVVLKEIW
jgi:LmbE family N-acetylglucosaminyl deacetylase